VVIHEQADTKCRPNNLAQAVTVLRCIRSCPVQILAGTPTIVTYILRGFLLLWRNSPNSGVGHLIVEVSISQTITHAHIAGRTPLD
jgi:hypothetical protein